MTALRITSMSKKYGRVEAVRDLSLTVERGDLYGLLGPNGSGKTTTLRCTLGLLRPDRGSVELLGVPVGRIAATAGRVAVVFDQAHLVPRLTAVDNLVYARGLLGHDGGRTIDEVLEIVELEHRRTHRPDELSLGQQRRLSIARALLGRPELVILDEPLSGLDALGVARMLELFRRLRDEGLTIVLSTHRLHEMESVITRAGILLDGRIVAEDDRDALLGGPGTALRVEVAAADAERAAARLTETARTPAERTTSGTSGLAALRVVLPDDVAPPAVARALLDADVPLHALVPERRTLQTTFERLVAEHRATTGDAA